MTTVWERAAHSVLHTVSVFCFESGTLALIASVPGHCLPSTINIAPVVVIREVRVRIEAPWYM